MYRFTPEHVGADYTFYAEQNGNIAPHLDMFLLPSGVDLETAINAKYSDLRGMCLTYSDAAANGENTLTYRFTTDGTYYILYKPSESHTVGKRLFTASYKMTPQELSLGENVVLLNDGSCGYVVLKLGNGYDYTLSAEGTTFTLYNIDMTINKTEQSTISFYKTGDVIIALSSQSGLVGITVNTSRVRTIYYVTGTEEGIEPTTYFNTCSFLQTPQQAPMGYEFAGWYDNAELTGSAITGWSAGMTGNKTLYAKYTQPQNYTITYYNTGGAMVSSGEYVTQYNRASFDITLPRLWKSDHDFCGWYDNPGFTGKAVTSIPSGSEGE